MSNSLWPYGLYSVWNSPGQNTGVASHSFLLGIFPTQGSNAGVLQWRQILHHLSHQGSPRTLQCISYPFSRGSFQPRNRTRVSCIAGGFFTSWANRGALENWVTYSQKIKNKITTWSRNSTSRNMPKENKNINAENWKCWTQYVSKFGKLINGHSIGKGLFSFQSQRRALASKAETSGKPNLTYMWSLKIVKISYKKIYPVVTRGRGWKGGNLEECGQKWKLPVIT